MPKKAKPGPKEQVHTLHPLTFGQALEKVLTAKPPKREPAPKRKARKKK
jgi:hypothetical protein